MHEITLQLADEEAMTAFGARLATDSHGKLVSLRHESINSTSTTDAYTEPCASVTKSLYACPNVLVSHKNVPVNRGTPTSMRAPSANDTDRNTPIRVSGASPVRLRR